MRFRHALGALLIATLAIACSHGGGITPTPTATPTVATQAPRSTPTPTPATAFDIALSDLALTYSADWRLGDQTDSSVAFTLRDAPEDATFSVQWSPSEGTTDEVATAFRDRLELTAGAVQDLPDIRVGNVIAKRFASVIGSGDGQRVVLHTVFATGGKVFLATYSATPEAFPAHSAQAEALLATLQPH